MDAPIDLPIDAPVAYACQRRLPDANAADRDSGLCLSGRRAFKDC